MTKQISLGNDKFALVDDEDFERVNQRQWTPANGGRYARATIRKDGLSTLILMHRFILDTPPGMDTDHINGDGLDNRRANLRISTHAENMRNRFSSRGLKGVHFRKGRQVYQAYISVDKKLTRLGHFISQEAAACAYDYAAKELHGEFARLNFPDGQPLTPEQVEEFRYRAARIAPYRGLGWHPKKQKWGVKIGVKYKVISLGYFTDPIAAAKAYNEAAIKYHGDKAKLNNI